MDALWRDVRFGLRTLAKNRSFTAFAVLTLALGIGVNTAMFSLAANLLLRPLPVSQPSELVAVGTLTKTTGAAKPGLSWQMYVEYRDNSSASFTGLAAYSEKTPMPISRTDGSTTSADAAVVTGNYFDVLGVRPFRGRLISAEDDRGTSDANVAVLSHRAWRELFGGRTDALGATVRLGGSSYTVIGVTPPDFTGISLDSTPDVWIPMESQIHANTLAAMFAKNIDSPWFKAVARLKSGVNISQARQQLETAAIQLGAGKSINLGWKTVGGRSVADHWIKPQPTLSPLEDTRGGSSRAFLLFLFGAIALLFLLVVCDIASMLLARFERRRREVAIRLALGASRIQVARPIVIEGLLLSTFGALSGLFVAYWSIKFLLLVQPIQVQWHTSLFTSFLEGRALLFTILVTVFAGLFFSLAPAIRAARSNVLSAMSSDAPTSTTGRPRTALRGGLIVFQTSVSVLLLAATLLFLQTYWVESRVPLSYDPHGGFEFALKGSRSFGDNDAEMDAWHKLLETVKSTPGIHHAGLGLRPLLVGVIGMTPGYPYQSQVSAGYFDAVGTPLIRGRDFSSQDRAGTPLVAIINQTMAEQSFSRKDPIGQSVKHSVLLSDGSIGYETAEVIGVVADTQTRGAFRHEDMVLFTPLAQRHFDHYIGPRSFTLLVRGDGNTASVRSLVRSAVDRFDNGADVSGGITFADAIADRFQDLRLDGELFAGFAILAVLLTASGLYGLISYITTARTHELGLRLALGASRPAIVRLILRDGLILTLVGVVVGIGFEFGLMRFLSGFMQGAKPVDVPTSGIVALILFCAALAACYVPARRASRLDPMVALRHN
jgi:putative ABC transport system permease protein